MRKPIAVFDIETTGLSEKEDHIIQISVSKYNPEVLETGIAEPLAVWNHYITPKDPDWKMSPTAQARHGLTKEFIISHGDSLELLAPSLLEFIDGCDMAGYNSNKFDVRFLATELERIGYELPMDGIKFYDVYATEIRLHPNDLDSVLKRYTGFTMEDHCLRAHDSSADVQATAIVLAHQLYCNSLTLEDLGEWEENNLISPEGSIRKSSAPGEPTVLVFSIGKYKDQEIYEVMCEDPSYLKWWASNVAHKRTLLLVREYCKNRREQEKNSNKK